MFHLCWELKAGTMFFAQWARKTVRQGYLNPSNRKIARGKSNSHYIVDIKFSIQKD
jgi:hypothetical protein